MSVGLCELERAFKVMMIYRMHVPAAGKSADRMHRN